MPRKTKDPEVEPSNTWTCMDCAGQPQFQHKEMMEHLRDAHGLTMPLKGFKKLVMHLDAPTYHTTTYEWKIGGIKACQTVVCPRAKNSPWRSR